MLVEILYFDGCPNYMAVRDLVERVSAEAGVDPEIRMVEVPDVEAAERLRFLGSPSVRVDGRDVEPGADGRNQFMRACRVYVLASGVSGQPDGRWVRNAVGGPQPINR
jgi:hypothetical protein